MILCKGFVPRSSNDFFFLNSPSLVFLYFAQEVFAKSLFPRFAPHSGFRYLFPLVFPGGKLIFHKSPQQVWWKMALFPILSQTYQLLTPLLFSFKFLLRSRSPFKSASLTPPRRVSPSPPPPHDTVTIFPLPLSFLTTLLLLLTRYTPSPPANVFPFQGSLPGDPLP